MSPMTFSSHCVWFGFPERQPCYSRQHFLGVKERQRAAERDERRRGEERGAVLERGDDLSVHHARIACQHALHPEAAVAVHQGVQAKPAAWRQLDNQGIAEPGAEEPGDR